MFDNQLNGVDCFFYIHIEFLHNATFWIAKDDVISIYLLQHQCLFPNSCTYHSLNLAMNLNIFIFYHELIRFSRQNSSSSFWKFFCFLKYLQEVNMSFITVGEPHDSAQKRQLKQNSSWPHRNRLDVSFATSEWVQLAGTLNILTWDKVYLLSFRCSWEVVEKP